MEHLSNRTQKHVHKLYSVCEDNWEYRKSNSKMCKLYNLHLSNPIFNVLYENTPQAPQLHDNTTHNKWQGTY